MFKSFLNCDNQSKPFIMLYNKIQIWFVKYLTHFLKHRLKILRFCIKINFVILSDSLLCDGVCVTWDLHNTQLEITCKMQARYSTVSLVDNFGRRLISCSSPEVENSNKNCQRSSIDEIVAVNYLSTELMLTIQRNQVTDYDGQWTCQADSNETQTNVSSQIGKVIYIIFDIKIALFCRISNIC